MGKKGRTTDDLDVVDGFVKCSPAVVKRIESKGPTKRRPWQLQWPGRRLRKRFGRDPARAQLAGDIGPYSHGEIPHSIEVHHSFRKYPDIIIGTQASALHQSIETSTNYR